jgi:protease-4
MDEQSGSSAPIGQPPGQEGPSGPPPHYQPPPQYVPYYAPPPRRGLGWLWPVFGGILGCLPWIVLFFVVVGLIASGLGSEAPQGNIALIRIEGVIVAGKSGGTFLGGRVSGSETVAKLLKEARDSGQYKAVVLRVNSPGGSAGGSQEIYQAIKKVREAGKPVVVSMGDIAASGGYYVSAPADKIVANPACDTGSIGVIISWLSYEGLMQRYGVSNNTLTAGKYKDIGSSYRKVTPEERKLIQGLLDDTYDQFIQAVAEGRNLDAKRVRSLAEGKIYTGRQAQKLGLVDQLGTLDDAVNLAGKLGHVARPEPAELEHGTLFDRLFGTDLRAKDYSHLLRDDRMVWLMRLPEQ